MTTTNVFRNLWCDDVRDNWLRQYNLLLKSTFKCCPLLRHSIACVRPWRNSMSKAGARNRRTQHPCVRSFGLASLIAAVLQSEAVCPANCQRPWNCVLPLTDSRLAQTSRMEVEDSEFFVFVLRQRKRPDETNGAGGRGAASQFSRSVWNGQSESSHGKPGHPERRRSKR